MSQITETRIRSGTYNANFKLIVLCKQNLREQLSRIIKTPVNNGMSKDTVLFNLENTKYFSPKCFTRNSRIKIEFSIKFKMPFPKVIELKFKEEDFDIRRIM